MDIMRIPIPTDSSLHLSLSEGDLHMATSRSAIRSLERAAAAVLLASLPAALAAGDQEPWRRQVPIIDLHGHIAADAIDEAIRAMDANFIHLTVQLTPGRNAEQFRASKALFDEKGRGRFLLYVNDVYRNFPIEEPGYGEKVARIVEECAALGARGLKISKTLGLYWKDRDGKIIPVDDPRLDPMWAACGRLGIPVSIHTGDPKAFWLPPDERNERWEELRLHPEWSFYGDQYPPREEVLAQRNRVIARHEGVTFVGVHFGNNPEDPDYVAALLRKHGNLHVDISARLGEIGRHDPAKMRAMFLEFQDRILFGTDFMVSRDGYILGAGPRLRDEAEVKKFFEAHWRFLETDARQVDHPTPIQGTWKIDGIGLPREVLEKIYFRNAARLLKLERES
jgi:predicted TIM-barrel fold metal-dependent hydrolase